MEPTVAIIKDDQGRWQTVTTPAEEKETLLDQLRDLSPDEKALLRELFSSAVKKDNKPYETLSKLEYAEQPCPPEKFLEDPYYFGEVGRGTYDWIKRTLPDIFYKGYEEIVATGSQRTGKDWAASCVIAYLIHLLLCLKDPGTSYGLAKGSNIYIVFMSATQELSREAMYVGFLEKMKQSPWFQNFGKAIKPLSEEIRFPKGLVLKGAESADMGVVGLNTCAVVIDEANLGRKVKAIHEHRNQLMDRTEAIYQAVRRRIRMTFTAKGRPPTLLMTLGSRRYPSDFVDRRILELKNTPKALVLDMPIWEAKGRENFDAKSFRVLVGDENVTSRVLKEGEKAPANARVIDVPEDFRSDFEGDCDGALRDIAGIAVRTIAPYISDQQKIADAVDDSRSHPYRTIEWKVNEPYQVLWDRLVALRDGKYLPILAPDKPRCVAIDLGRVRNPTGIAIGYVRGFKTITRRDKSNGVEYQENLPAIVVEFLLRISPTQHEEVKFYKVRELIFDFIQHGIPIKYSAHDHWQSDDCIQIFTEQGIEGERIKTDAKSYDNLKNALYEERVKYYRYKPLIDELGLLEDDPKRRKVDIFSQDTGNNHHDVADALCLLINRLSQGFRPQDFEPIAPEFDIPDRSSTKSLYPNLAPGDTPFELEPGEKSAMGLNLPGLRDELGGAGAPGPGTPPAEPSLYGMIMDDKEAGWGGADKRNQTQDPTRVPIGSQVTVRVEELAQEFCRRIKVQDVEFVKATDVKAFLFEKKLVDTRYVIAIRNYIERIYEKRVL